MWALEGLLLTMGGVLPATNDARALKRRTVSVIIPCFNDATLLDRALASLNQQSIAADEILVVDNGSTDNSAEVAKRHGARVVEESKRGITWATQTGFNNATGDILFRTDADIVAPQDLIAKLHAAWNAADESQQATGAREVAAVTGSATFELPAPWNRIASKSYIGAYRSSTKSALGHNPMFGTLYSIRASWWQTVKETVDFSDTFVHEDMHLSFQVRPNETVWYQDDLEVLMDGRALFGFKQVITRFKRGFHTMFTNWRTQSPPIRLSQRGVLPKQIAQVATHQLERKD